MTNAIATEYLYLAERRIDCDGRGWAFARLTLPDSLVTAYVDSLRLWEHECAKGYNAMMDMFHIPAASRLVFVNDGLFDRSVAQNSDVRAAVTALYAAQDAIKLHVSMNEVKTFGIPLDECEFVGHDDFKARYWPLVLEADANNGNHWHEDYLMANDYTSIFNGR